MIVWENKGTPEAGKFVVCFDDEDKTRIEKARRSFLKSDDRRELSKETVYAVKQNLAKFIGNNVFCYEDENGEMLHEAIVTHAAVGDTRNVLLLSAQNSLIDRRGNIALAKTLIDGAMEVELQSKQETEVPNQDTLCDLILT